MQAKWNNLKSLHKKESKNIIKNTKIDYRTIYPSNFEKQKVNLVLNVFNDITIVALKQDKFDGTALFVTHRRNSS